MFFGHLQTLFTGLVLPVGFIGALNSKIIDKNANITLRSRKGEGFRFSFESSVDASNESLRSSLFVASCSVDLTSVVKTLENEVIKVKNDQKCEA